MTEQVNFITKRIPSKQQRMEKNVDVKNPKIAEMLNLTYSPDEFEESLKNAIVALHK